MSDADKGFGSMPKEKVEEIGKKGGETSRKDGTDEKSHKEAYNNNK